jgi:hypothetical protein
MFRSFSTGLFGRVNHLRVLSVNKNPLRVDLEEDTFLGLTSLNEINLEDTPLGAAKDHFSPIFTKHLINLARFIA